MIKFKDQDMEIIADLHLHSKYSRAVSQLMEISEITRWAFKKGISLVATGDWTHPLWLKELQTNLEEAGEGIYKPKLQTTNPKLQTKEVYFLLSTEIASIYSQDGRLKRIHTIVFAPNFEVVEKINEKLRLSGVNLMSDGRPITGLSVRQLAEVVFSVSQDCLVIPSHAWTPWFGIYGDKGGFDSLNEAFGNLAKNIYAIETGLSSSPAMNWRVKELDNRAIVSFSDAHSPQKLGREATVFNIEEKKWGYDEIKNAIINRKIVYTIEFYPEEGKYHYTGHRNCGVRQSPLETKKLGEICPVCGRSLTVGVMHRVEELADRDEEEIEIGEWNIGQNVKGVKWDERAPYVMLVPLLEILAESLNNQEYSQKVLNEYNNLTKKIGSEFEVLLNAPLEEIAKISGQKVAEGIKKVREKDIVIEPGFDGVFGVVKIWPDNKDVIKEENREQMTLF